MHLVVTRRHEHHDRSCDARDPPDPDQDDERDVDGPLVVLEGRSVVVFGGLSSDFGGNVDDLCSVASDNDLREQRQKSASG